MPSRELRIADHCDYWLHAEWAETILPDFRDQACERASDLQCLVDVSLPNTPQSAFADLSEPEEPLPEDLEADQEVQAPDDDEGADFMLALYDS